MLLAGCSEEELQPTGLQLDIILKLHRHNDAYIAFAVRDEDGVWHDVRAIHSGSIQLYLPWVEQRLAKDSYLSINADQCIRRHGVDGAAWGVPRHSEKGVAYLCACYCDLDYYNTRLGFGQAFGLVIDYQNAGIIPPASLVGNSGRGLWIFWLLRDVDEPRIAQRMGIAHERLERLETYRAIQIAIIKRLRSVGADPNGKDAARWWRVPGSFRTDIERTVTYWPRYDQYGKEYTYTLQELADFFGVRSRPSLKHPKIQEAVMAAEKVVPEYRRRAWRSLHNKRLRDIQTLIASRGGGFNQGCRQNGAVVLASHTEAEWVRSWRH